MEKYNRKKKLMKYNFLKSKKASHFTSLSRDDVGKASHWFNYINLRSKRTTQHFSCGLDETRTRDLRRDRAAF